MGKGGRDGGGGTINMGGNLGGWDMGGGTGAQAQGTITTWMLIAYREITRRWVGYSVVCSTLRMISDKDKERNTSQSAIGTTQTLHILPSF